MGLTIKDSTLQKTIEVIAEVIGIDPEEIDPNDQLMADLELGDEIEFKRIITRINKYFGIELATNQVIDEYEGIENISVQALATRITEALELG